MPAPLSPGLSRACATVRVPALLFVAVLFLIRPLAVPSQPSPSPSGGPAAGQRTVQLLRQMLALDTSHPKGRKGETLSAPTLALARLLESQLAPLGAEITTYTGPKNQATHFIARLRGDGSKRPVLLAAHGDVVPVERERWTFDPFAGTLKDGFVYGRGALDFKGGLAVFTRAVMMLAERRVPLARDVILLSEADEEEGDFDTDWLADHHWKDIDAEFVLNEGGWILEGEPGRPPLVSISTADKVAVNFTITARGASTHSSRPLPASESAVPRLVAALSRIAAYDPGPKLTPQTRAWLEALARTSRGSLAADLRVLASTRDPRRRADAARRAVAESRHPLLLRALLRDTLAITMVEAGYKKNVIPGIAEANVNARLLPGTRPEAVLAELRRVVAGTGVEIRVVGGGSDAMAGFRTRSLAPPSSASTPLFRALAGQARRVWPGAEVVAGTFEAGTDARPWRKRGVPVYGVYPYPVDAETLLRMHGHDERVGAARLEQGTAWIHRVLREVAGR